jgi:hypothetical protein
MEKSGRSRMLLFKDDNEEFITYTDAMEWSPMDRPPSPLQLSVALLRPA